MTTSTTTAPLHDAIIVGGGAAGLSGALMLARSRRDVLIIDAGEPRNAPSPAVHALLGHDGIAPAELMRRGREEVTGYGAAIVDDRAVSARRDGADGPFTITTASGAEHRGRRLLLTTGLIDELPAIDGLAEHWGHSVVHCPYCHGYEVRDQRIAVIATGPMAVHQALLFRQLSDDVTVFQHELAEIPAEGKALLEARGIPVVPGRISRILSTDRTLSGLELEDGRTHPAQAVAVGTRMVARGDLLTDLGLELEEHPSGMGSQLPADPMTGQTAVPGIWAAGNLTSMPAQVGPASAAGAMAGAQINADLVMAEAQTALATQEAAQR